MFNVKHPTDDVLMWLGESLGETGPERLGRFAKWLEDEALPAGGIGPREGARILSRHVAESLAFGCGVDRDADSVLDVGSGVGLPGIPLAILRPQTHFVLLDRSGRRVDLAARAVHVVGVPNVSVVQADVEEWSDRHDGLVMRAALRPEAVLPHLKRLVRPGRHAVIGLSRARRHASGDGLAERAASFGLALDVLSVSVLDSPIYLLRITRDDDISPDP